MELDIVKNVNEWKNNDYCICFPSSAQLNGYKESCTAILELPRKTFYSSLLSIQKRFVGLHYF